jgi:HSP20 family protein
MFGNPLEIDGLFDHLRRMERTVDQLFGNRAMPAGIRSVSRGSFPLVNVGATDAEVHVYLFAPGIESRDFNLTIQKNLLMISGQRKREVNDKATYFRRERFDGEFKRVITLPEDVDPQQVSAVYRDGVLQIVLKRHENSKPRQIQVN